MLLFFTILFAILFMILFVICCSFHNIIVIRSFHNINCGSLIFHDVICDHCFFS